MEVFNQHISIYRNVEDVVGKVTMISTFLNSRRYIEQVQYIRRLSTKVERDAEKVKLPLATMSGVFVPTRKSANLVQHSGFICIDIDGKDNPQFTDIEQVRPILENRPEVAYAAHSVSGTGYFALIPLKHPAYHKQQFRQLLIDYANLGIKLDNKCGDVCRLRCVSFDENPYINACATPYEGLLVEKMPDSYRPNYQNVIPDMKKVVRCCEVIRENAIDIADDYNDWFTIAAALSTLGEDGRYWFHVCSSVSPKYSVEDTDRKFTQCLHSDMKIGLGTFFYICQQYGVSYARR